MSDEGSVAMRERWYIVQIKPNSLSRAQANLERQGFACFAPRERRSVRRSGKFVTADLPVFPGYLFVTLNPENGSWRVINSTYGVARLVSFGAGPAPLPDGLMQALLARYGDGGEGEGTSISFRVGDAVVIREGPFADFVASVEAIDPERRVHLLIDFMGRHSRVTVEGDKLAKP